MHIIVPPDPPGSPRVTLVALGGGVFVIAIANSHLVSPRGVEAFEMALPGDSVRELGYDFADSGHTIFVVDPPNNSLDDDELAAWFKNVKGYAAKYLVAVPPASSHVVDDNRMFGRGDLTVTFTFDWGEVLNADILREKLANKLAELKRMLVKKDAFEPTATMTARMFAGIPTTVTVDVQMGSADWDRNPTLAGSILDAALSTVIKVLGDFHHSQYLPPS